MNNKMYMTYIIILLFRVMKFISIGFCWLLQYISPYTFHVHISFIRCKKCKTKELHTVSVLRNKKGVWKVHSDIVSLQFYGFISVGNMRWKNFWLCKEPFSYSLLYAQSFSINFVDNSFVQTSGLQRTQSFALQVLQLGMVSCKKGYIIGFLYLTPEGNMRGSLIVVIIANRKKA